MRDFNPRKYLVPGSVCPWAIGWGAPVVDVPEKQPALTGLVTSRLGDGRWDVHGDLTGQFFARELFCDLSRMSGRLRTLVALTKQLETRRGPGLTYGSTGPTWGRVLDSIYGAWALSGPGWVQFFRPHPGDTSIHVAGLLDMDSSYTARLPDGTLEADAIALRLACEAIGVGQ